MNTANTTVFKLYSDGIIPKRATKYSAGYDIALPYDVKLEPNTKLCVNTGVAIDSLDAGLEVFVLPRSGLFRKSGLLFNTDPSTVQSDSETKGIVLELHNVSSDTVEIVKGTNIGQIIFTAPVDPETEAVPYTVFEDGTLKADPLPEPHGILTLHVPGDITLEPHEAKVILTHKAFAFVPSKVMLLCPSPMTKALGVQLVNNTGVIDADYFGNPTNKGVVMVQLINMSEDRVTIPSKTPIVDAYTADYYVLALEEEPETERTGGLGSTDSNS